MCEHGDEPYPVRLKQAEGVPLKKKLISLFTLEKLDTALDELREERGDLPEKVAKLEAEAGEYAEKITECDKILSVGASERVKKERETIEIIEKIEKYKKQLHNVQTNKEYDALTKEIEDAEARINTDESDIERFTDEAVLIKTRKEQFVELYNAINEELAEKKKDLDEILQVNAAEENTLIKRREAILKEIKPDDLKMYLRIRDAKGKAVAPIKRNSCSGCFNVVPPQKILEIKKYTKVYTCEHCGRILVTEDLSEEIR
jgi:uncharacterized protein